MNWEFILTGAFGGAAANIIWNFLSKKLDYNIEYKKYILKRRQESYNLLELFINKISQSQGKKNNHIPSVLFPPERFRVSDLNREISLLFEHNIWLSLEMKKVVENFSAYIYILLKSIPVDIHSTELEKILWKEYETYAKHIKKFKEQFFNDIMDLPDIEKFRRQNRFLLKRNK